MLKWSKLGRIFDPLERRDESWMREFAQSPSVLVNDRYVRVYFCARPSPGADGQYVSMLSYVDLDRSNLLRVVGICRQPILALGGYGTFDEFGTNPASVIRHGNEVRVYYAGWTRCESVPFNAALGLAVSRDNGDTFSRIGDGPVLSFSPGEPFLIGSPRIRKYGGRWHLWYVAGKEWLPADPRPEPVYKIRMASSDDGVQWTKYGKDLIENALGAHECQACPDVMLRDGRYHMFFSYRQSHNYKGKDGGYRIGYASSRDMFDWSRNDAMAGMVTSDSGWDSEMVSYPHVFTLDGETYMLYQGNGMGRSGIGLARLDAGSDWNDS